MLRLVFCLLLAKSAFAAHAFPVEHTNYGPIGPDTNLVYNFEQIRRDQPPQIELREENIHKYRGRPRTTTPVPELPIDDGDMNPMHPLPYNEKQWEALLKAPKYEGPVQNWKNVPAPPSFPHWDTLSDLAVTNPKNYDSLPTYTTQQPIVVPEEPTQWSEPDILARAPIYMSTESTSTFAPTVPARQHPEPRQMHRANPAARGRGAHRFNWSDVTSPAPPTTLPSAPAPASGRMPPPAVPTLSPWYDGF